MPCPYNIILGGDIALQLGDGNAVSLQYYSGWGLMPSRLLRFILKLWGDIQKGNSRVKLRIPL
jgi:hypothetical protein